jgi:DNA-binding LacI/PurR family transcriptional regulator
MPTLQQVAAAAGVSVSAASRVLHGRGEFSAATRARVLAAADALGYRRSATTRGRPRSVDSRLIEFVVGRFGTAWTDAAVRGARDAAFRLGYDLALTVERPSPEDDWLERVVARRSSGVVLGVITPTRRQLERLRDLRLPLVALDPPSALADDLPSVGTTDRQGGADAGAHLADAASHLVVTGAPRYRFGRAREEGFREALQRARPGAAVQQVSLPWGRPVATDALRGALRRAAHPVGVFAVNDGMALAVLDAARELGLDVPRQVRVVGFDDEPRAALADPPLSSVHQPLPAMAALAVELLHDAQRGDLRAQRVELPAHLVIRRSST